MNGKGNKGKNSYAFHLPSLSSDVQSESKSFTLFHIKGVTADDTIALTVSCFLQ